MQRKELFIVEGKSAASTVRQALYKPDQEVFAVQGKIVNAQKSAEDKVLNDPVCSRLIEHLGCGINPCVVSKLNFRNIVILTDPDMDGLHSRVLLMMLFSRYMAPLVQEGLVSVVLPPLYRVGAPMQPDTWYLQTGEELEQFRAREAAADLLPVTRFRGIGQLSRDECHHLLVFPDTRKAIQLSYEQETPQQLTT